MKFNVAKCHSIIFESDLASTNFTSKCTLTIPYTMPNLGKYSVSKILGMTISNSMNLGQHISASPKSLAGMTSNEIGLMCSGSTRSI